MIAQDGAGVVLNDAGAPCVVDPDDPDPRGRLVTITGHVCRACGLPRVPYRGDGGVHPLCYRRTPTDREEETR